MRTFRNIFVICLLIILSALYSCRKKHKLSTIYLQSGILEWCDYKPNSFWIYNDTITNSIDSFYLFNRIEDIVEDIDRYGANIQFIIHYINNNDSNFQASILPVDSYRSYYDSWLIGVKFNFSVNSICVGNNFNGANCEGIIDTLKINNYDYSNVICYRNPFGESVVYSYWAKHIGVVRRVEMNKDSTILHVWDLIRYNVIQ